MMQYNRTGLDHHKKHVAPKQYNEEGHFKYSDFAKLILIVVLFIVIVLFIANMK
jgi:hypothetical protein